MNYSERLIDLRNEVLDALVNGKVFYQSDLDDRYESDESQDLYEALPSTTYYDKNGFGSEVKLLGYENGSFICYDGESGEIVYIESAWISTDTIVEYLAFNE